MARGEDGALLDPHALESALAAEMLQKVSIERIREELEKMLAHNTSETIKWLG